MNFLQGKTKGLSAANELKPINVYLLVEAVTRRCALRDGEKRLLLVETNRVDAWASEQRDFANPNRHPRTSRRLPE